MPSNCNPMTPPDVYNTVHGGRTLIQMQDELIAAGDPSACSMCHGFFPGYIAWNYGHITGKEIAPSDSQVVNILNTIWSNRSDVALFTAGDPNLSKSSTLFRALIWWLAMENSDDGDFQQGECGFSGLKAYYQRKYLGGVSGGSGNSGTSPAGGSTASVSVNGLTAWVKQNSVPALAIGGLAAFLVIKGIK